MPRSLIDANIFLELELKQSRSPECKEFLSLVAKGRIKAVTTDFILDSIALVMEDKGGSPEDIRKFFVSLALYKGLSVYALDLRDRIVATEEMIREELDFDDATSLAAMKRLKIMEIISLDRDFDRVEGLVRSEPKDHLK